MKSNHEVPELTNSEFDGFTKEGFVFVDFFAEWCMPCVMMAPIIDELSEKFQGKIKFGKVNVDENKKIVQKFNIRSIPHFILFRNGEVLEQFTGSRPSEELEERLKKAVK